MTAHSDTPDPAGAGSAVELDAVIVGGGIAGLWLARLLTGRGYAVVLLEADRLGSAQTLASQGLIHGGLKYALAGRLTRASEAIARMPARWRACLAGRGEVDLSTLRPRSEHYYMFAEASTLGRLTAFFASRGVRGRIRRVPPGRRPAAFANRDFRGVVYELDDFVVDVPALLRTLREPVAGQLYRARVEPAQLRRGAGGVEVALPQVRLRPRRLLLTAGAGTGALLEALGVARPRMQLRPLHQVVVRHGHRVGLFAHCLTGIRRPEPRLTITSHDDDRTWYLGGQIATDGVAMSAGELADHARRELTECLPWLAWDDADIATLRIDRAEPAQSGGNRPDEAFATEADGCIVAWPTKLSLVPDLGDKVLALLPPPAQAPPPALPLPPAEVGVAAWAR